MLNKGNRSSISIESDVEGNTYQWKLATTLEEREAAYNLIYNIYLEAGLTKPRESQLWLTLFDTLEDTVVVVIKKDDAIIGSATIVIDSPFGLPLEELYKDEANRFRTNSSKLCEAISLGIAKEFRHPKLFLQLIHAAALYLHDVVHCTDALSTVHPRQTAIYQSMGFELIGDERSFSKVNNLPAVLFRVELKKIKSFFAQSRTLADKSSPFYQSFFTAEQETRLIELFQATRCPIREEELHYFFNEKTDLLSKATDEQRQLILKHRRKVA